MTSVEKVLAIRKGDIKVFDQIYRDHRNHFCSWACSRYACDEADAKDFYQDLMTIFYYNIQLGKYDGERSNIKTYLYAIGKNKAREWSRKKYKESNKANLVFQNLIEETSIKDYSQDYEIKLNLVYNAMDKIGEPCKSTLEMYYLQQMSMQEIATYGMYKNENSAKTQKYKCLKRFRAIIGKMA